MCGVDTISYPAFTCAFFRKSSKRERKAAPLGNHSGSPCPTLFENINNSNCFPNLRWSRFFASSKSAKYSFKSFCLGKEIP